MATLRLGVICGQVNRSEKVASQDSDLHVELHQTVFPFPTSCYKLISLGKEGLWAKRLPEKSGHGDSFLPE